MPTLLAADRVTFAYSSQPVLREVSLRLAEGEVVALLGPNGSGKSTLIRVLLGHLHASGSIRWDDRDLSSWSRREFAKRVAYLPQNPTHEPEHRVDDVLRLGRAAYWKAFGIESAHDAAVVDRVAQMLDLNDLLNRKMESLSGGQRQRVFLGRCLVQEPAAMLLDEPNTFLDLKHQVELSNLLKRLASEQRIAILMASHDLNLASMLADRIILLNDGAVVREGAAETALDPEIVSQVYGLPMERIPRPAGRPLIFPRL